MSTENNNLKTDETATAGQAANEAKENTAGELSDDELDAIAGGTIVRPFIRA